MKLHPLEHVAFSVTMAGEERLEALHPLANTSHMVLPNCKGGWEAVFLWKAKRSGP